MKKIVCAVLSAALLIPMAIPGFATIHDGQTTKTARVAIVKNVADNGENLTDDYDTGSNATLQDVDLHIIESNGKLHLSANLGNDSIDVTGIPAARSANKHAIFFNGTSGNPKYKVVNLAYIDTAETNMYFKSYSKETKAGQILKVYLRDVSSETRDYIIIECFDFILPNVAPLMENLPQDTVMGAWVTREFTPLSVNYTDVQPRYKTNNLKRTYVVKFKDFRIEQVHTISLALDCSYSDIPVGQHAVLTHRVEIVKKTVYCKEDPILNSDTESALHVNAIKLRQTTRPNVAFISTEINGRVQNNDLFGRGELSANIGVSLGVLGLSLALPVNFTPLAPVDLNSTFKDYVNGRDGKYSRSVEITMDDKFKLTQIGYFFSVTSVVADFGNVAKSAADYKAEWEIEIINASPEQSTKTHLIEQNVRMAIV